MRKSVSNICCKLQEGSKQKKKKKGLILYKKHKPIERKRCEKKGRKKKKNLRVWAGLALDFPEFS